MPDELLRLLHLPPVRDDQRNVPRPDFQQVLYVFCARILVVRDGELICIPARWLVVDRRTASPDD